MNKFYFYNENILNKKYFEFNNINIFEIITYILNDILLLIAQNRVYGVNYTTCCKYG